MVSTKGALTVTVDNKQRKQSTVRILFAFPAGCNNSSNSGATASTPGDTHAQTAAHHVRCGKAVGRRVGQHCQQSRRDDSSGERQQ